MTATLAHVEQQPAQPADGPYGRRRLAGGVVGRVWLWFVAGCLAVTLVPVLFGWHPYVIQSGSMLPRIKVGDIVIASPNDDARQLLGHVTVFQDPDRPSRVKTHRVIRITGNGALVTRGDANQSADSQPVRVGSVHGMGRLLVRYAGLPVVWAHTGKWLYLLLFGLSLYLAGLAVARDREPEDEADDLDGAMAGKDRRRPLGVERRVLKRAGRRLVWRTVALLGLALILAVPTTRAAFASATRNTGDTWSVPNWNYTTEANLLGPYIYYKLDEASPDGTANDSSVNNRDGTYSGTSTNFRYQQGGAFVSDAPNTGVTQRSNNACIYTSGPRPAPGPQVYSEIVWFRTASGYDNGGKLVGFETAQTGVSSSAGGGQYDRHVYMDGSGRLRFGVWLTTPGATRTISTASAYNDGSWHMMVATMGAGAAGGMRLYVDGVLRASDANTTSETFANPGYWRFGCGNLSGWGGAASWSGANAPSTTQANRALQGSLDEVAVYHTQLTAAQIAFLYWIR